MYTKEERKSLITAFWSDFRIYMSKHRSANGRKMNWVNYPSDVKYIYIRLDADESGARFCFDIQAKDVGVRGVIWEQMYELKNVLELHLGTDGEWIENCSSPVIPQFNRIVWEQKDLNFLNPADRPAIFSFFEDKLIHFDAFYQDFKDILINLTS